MKKLSTIFEAIDNTQIVHQRYLSDLLLESYLFEEKLVESKPSYTSQEVEEMIFEKSIDKGNEREALEYAEGVFSFLDEAFTSGTTENTKKKKKVGRLVTKI